MLICFEDGKARPVFPSILSAIGVAPLVADLTSITSRRGSVPSGSKGGISQRERACRRQLARSGPLYVIL